LRVPSAWPRARYKDAHERAKDEQKWILCGL
jgi:hypothetical protein